MSIQNEILYVLEQKRGDFFSGQDLANKLGLSRQAIWKGIKALKVDGHDIVARNNVGYSLSKTSDMISRSEISALFGTHSSILHNLEIITFKSIDSTSMEAKRLLSSGKSNNFLIIADEQTNGLGRTGKSFFSPKNSIYMSLAITIDDSYAVCPHEITCATAVAVMESITFLTNLYPKIKWVNDILLDNKKICGILTEGILDFECGKFRNVVIGIGINCNQNINIYPNELRKIVSSLPLKIPRNQLIASVISNLFDNLFQSNGSIMEKYRDNSMIIGREIIFQPQTERIFAKAIDITKTGYLVAQKADGTIFEILSGVVEIVGLYD